MGKWDFFNCFKDKIFSISIKFWANGCNERKDNKLVHQRDVQRKNVKAKDGRMVPKQEDK